MLKIVIAFAISLLVAGCATEERISQYQACRVQGIEKFPVQSVPQTYMDIEYFQKQEGMTCTRIPSGFYNAGGMECEPNMRTYQRQVQKTRYIDSNTGIRNSWIGQCVNQQCLSNFGNSDCNSRNARVNAQSSLEKAQLERYIREVQTGNSNAQFNLGLMYRYGQGVIQDNSKAYMWLNFAERNGNSSAKDIKNSIFSRMTDSDIEKTRKMISECMKNNYKNC